MSLSEDIPFPDDKFDVVLSSLMIHHLPGEDLKRRGFTEIWRVLKPGGRLLVVDFEPPTEGPLRLLLGHILGLHRMMENDVRRLTAVIEAAGFTEVEVGRTSHRLLSLVRGIAGQDRSPGREDWICRSHTQIHPHLQPQTQLSMDDNSPLLLL
ncbi:MAG: class I SAM-dependent methyltransferase [Anaerolineae bacterium]